MSPPSPAQPSVPATDPRKQAPATEPGPVHGWAGLLPTLCAMHCLVTPALIAVFPFVHFLETVEPVLYAASLVLASWAVGSGFRRHRNPAVWLPTLAGALIWGASIAGFLQPLPESVTDVAGGLLLAAGVFWSGRLRHRSVCDAQCSCPAPH